MVVERPQSRPQTRARSVLARFLETEGPSPWGSDPAQWDALAIASTKPKLDAIFGPGRYLRVRAEGLDELPDRNVMLVSNHCGGTTILDAIGLGWAWIEHFGTSRPLHAMVHDLLLANPLTGRPLSRIGALRACRANARRAVGEFARDLVVYPGGDQDTWRPFARGYEVCFAGRKGYARIALEQGVPIVPVGHAGAHESFVVLARGRRLARAMGIPRIARAEVWPIHLSLPWGLAVGPVPHLPLPVRFDYRFGAPVPFPSGYRPGRPVSEGQVADYDRAVRDALQAELDVLRRSRRRFLRRWTSRFTR
ncbi:MAG: 1-acyl-sn-glycerol-3-phosphate acyltransferase [Myxococcota bacterium]